MSLESDIKESKRVVEPFDDDDCAVCLEPLANDADERTVVKLRCSHKFHLDCVGSSFNIKNKMECPCCRQIEKGKWLFAEPVDQLEEDDMSPLDMLTNMVSPSFLHIDDGIFTNIASVLFPNAPNQISNNANVSSNPLGEPRNTLLDTRMQRQIDEHVSPTVDSERRLPDMLLELHDRTGGSGPSGYGRERSGGGGGENSRGGEAVAEEDQVGEAAEGAEMMDYMNF
ncbi:putative transcription factor C2H2 family [Arabidopsis thaliana]